MIPVLQIGQALAMLPPQMDTPQARVMLVAIGLQESRFTARRQLVGNPPRPTGPARGYWQFERGGGCAGVLTHPSSRYWMHTMCEARGCKPMPDALWKAIENDDVLAAAAARLLLFTDPKRLPSLGDESGSWALYIRTWRPGKPHRDTWGRLYRQAMDVCSAVPA
jgi:hypothetical protein